MVEDTGPGIPDDKRESIFQPFTQVDGSISRRHGGTGLGLSIARRLVRRMGGELLLESEVGRGSTFSFELHLPPVSSSQARDGNHSADLGKLDSTFAGRFPARLLLVEDNPVNLKLLLRMFAKLGYENILSARNGHEALSIFQREKVDVIFMDLQMPEMDGFTATEKIRALESISPPEKRIFISALTANVNPSDRRKCFDLGMDHYLSKPVNTRTLAETIALACPLPR